MDRPSRKTKAVNYSESKDFDDDDFACVKAPPAKKTRDDMKQQDNKKFSRSSIQETNAKTAQIQQNRKPLDMKLYERELETAIALSLLHSSDETSAQSPAFDECTVVLNPADENTDPSSLHLSNCSVNSTSLGLDQITAEKNSPAPSKQRKEAPESQRIKPKSQDEDYQPDLASDSECDNDFSEPESDDEEFTVKKEKVAKKGKAKQPNSNKKQKQPLKPKSADASTPKRTPLMCKNATEPTRSASSSEVTVSKPAASLSPAAGRVPKWNPPGQIGKSPSSSKSPPVRSPGQGLRLGLSRHVRVKPLHPSR